MINIYYRCIKRILAVLTTITSISSTTAQLNLPAPDNNWRIENRESIFFDAGIHAAYTDHG